MNKESQPQKGVSLKQRWTDEELQMLYQDYHDDVPLKVMARKYGRTVSAINKKLTRIYFRLSSFKKFPLFYEGIPPANSTPSQKPSKKRHRSPNRYISNDKEIWVDFADVIQWLKSNNISVSGPVFDPIKGKKYILNNEKIVTKQAVLIAANQNRYEKKMTRFLVDGITDGSLSHQQTQCEENFQ